MLNWIPAPLHRAALRIAHRLRRNYRKFVKPDLYGVSIMLRDQQDRVLLVRHTYGIAGWALPGGGIGKNEDPDEGIRREIREELGCALHNLERVRTFSEVISGTQHTGHMFQAYPATEPQVDGRELSEAKWFALEELHAAELTPVTRQRLTVLGLL